MSKRRNDTSPEVYALKKGDKGWEVTRRDFLKQAGATGAALAASLGKKKKVEAEEMAPYPNNCPQVLAHKDAVTSLAFSPDGRHLFSGSKDQTLKVWEVDKQGLIKVLSKHSDTISSMSVSRDGEWLLTASKDNSIGIWALPNVVFKRYFKRHDSDVVGVGFLPDSRQVVSASNYGSVINWKAPDCIAVTDWNPQESTYSLAVNRAGTIVATGHWHDIKLWSLQSGKKGKLIKEFGKFSEYISQMVFSPDGKFLITAGDSSQYLRIWNIPEGTLKKSVHAHFVSTIHSLAMDPLGGFVATGAGSDVVKVRNFPQGIVKNKLSINKVDATSLAFSPDGSILAVGQADGKIRLHRKLSQDFLGCLMDVQVNESTKKGIRYKYRTPSGNYVTVTVPDSSCTVPMPPQSICVCNTVPGACSCVGHSCSCVGYTCGCQGECSCVGYCGSFGHYWYPN